MKRHHRALLLPWAGGNAAMAYTNKVIALSPIAYWPMAEASGSVALDASGNGCTGAYTAVTLGATGIGDGRTAATFDGSTSVNNIYTASLNGAFSGPEGTCAGWAIVSGAGVWTDGANRQFLRITRNGSNILFARKTTTNNQVGFTYTAGGTAKAITSALSVTTYFHWALTWSASGDAVKAYINGVQVGSTQTGLGTWSVGALDSTATVVGAANTTPSEVWSGSLAHVAIWTSALSAAQILSLATVP